MCRTWNVLALSILLLSGPVSMAQSNKAYFGVDYDLDPVYALLTHGGWNPLRWDNVGLYAGYFTDRYTSVEAFTNFGEYEDRNYFSGNSLELSGVPDRFRFATIGFRINLGSDYNERGSRWYFLLGAEAIFFGATYSEREVTYTDPVLNRVVSERWAFPRFKYQGWGLTLLGFRFIWPVSSADLSWTSTFTLPLLKNAWNDMPDATVFSSTIGVLFR